MRVLAPYPDAELVMLDLLSSVAAGVTHTGDALQAPTVQVQRIGGSDDGVTDRPRVQVTCYGATRAEAWQLAEETRQIVLAAAGTAVSGSYVTGVLIDSTRTVTPAQQLPERNPDLRVVSAAYELAMRRPWAR